MITLEDFYRNYTKFRPIPNPEQQKVLTAPPEQPLFVVAGPGTGKTTCLSLRILKLILVDGLPPQSILATTFTKKAAEELRSRILGWGFRLLEELSQDVEFSDNTQLQLSKLDINQILTGTLDSLCERILRDYRDPGSQPPILVDEFVSKTLMLRNGLFKNQRHQDGNLEQFLLEFVNNNRYGWHIGKKNDLLLQLWDRRFQDQVNWKNFLATLNNPLLSKTIETTLDDYHSALNEQMMVDFALLEQSLLDRLRQEKLQEFTQNIQAILVDEYQDSNLLQENIYFELSRASQSPLTVVGDDDQSLYRFRGATVELFSRFDQRHERYFDHRPQTEFLVTNYRSTPNIIEFVNQYVTLDPEYQNVRVNNKPRLSSPHLSKDEAVNAHQVPVLGMFRPDLETLANDLAEFIWKVFRGEGYRLPNNELIQAAQENGNVGDCALLCSSPQERKPNGGDLRLPGLLRQNLGERIKVFNPRGQTLTEIPRVTLLGGLLLQCLDQDAAIANSTNGLDDATLTVFANWQDRAVDFLNSSSAPPALVEFVDGWANRRSRTGYVWPRSVPILDLIYALTHFFPEFYDDPEGQVFLEVFTRQLCAAEQIGKFKGRILHEEDNPSLSQASVREHLQNFLRPIASGTIKVNEDLLETFPPLIPQVDSKDKTIYLYYIN